MLKALVKKQFTEIFRGFFYDQKKKAARSKASAAAWILLFVFMLVFSLGGMFTTLSVSMCSALTSLSLDWLYFAVLGLMAVFIGVFGGVFSTYQGLYLAKDNDLLLSMPIPVRYIMISRLLGVYLLGLVFSALVMVPAVIVYLITVPFRLLSLVGCLVLFAVISLLVTVLSCALGWVVAKISVRLKNKSIVTVILSLAFLALYYLFYNKAFVLIQTLVENAASYAERIKGAAYGVYLFGSVGAGDPLAMLLFAALTAGLAALTWLVLSRSFLQIVSAGGARTKTKYREKAAVRKSVDSALRRREFARFLSSPNYMLNCGLGTLLLPALGVALLFRGNMLLGYLSAMLGGDAGMSAVMFCAVVCAVAAANDIVVPSVSLEGKSLWAVKSMPVTPWQVLRAKLAPQLLLTLPAVAVCLICGMFVLPYGPAAKALACLTALAFTVYSALFGLFLGLKMPLLDWTNETVPIKQSMNVMIALFAGIGYALVLGGGYFLFGGMIGAEVYLAAFCLLTLCAAALLLRWLKTKGAALFAEL